MCEAFLVARVTRLNEVIHVELADKRREVIVLEVLGQHFLSKLIRFVDDKTIAFMIPVDTVVVGRVLNYEEAHNLH
jgi:hypothetical protein